MREVTGVLAAIVGRKRRDLADHFAGTSLADLRSRASGTRLSLAAALAEPGARFVMEVKRSSPSEGALREDADPAALATAYRGSADAISVLVDTPFFGGSYRDLEAVRAAFEGPILAKDFVIDPRQVPEARLHGADAVLVMLSVLEDGEARAVINEAERLGMDSLVEAHDEAEVRRAVRLGARLIGINNRDLRTLEVDLGTTERLAGLVPADRVLVSESGIGSRADMERLACHVDAFLVGSALMKAARPAEAARTLAFGRVKVCGLTSPEDTARAAAAGATHAGFVLVPESPRAVALSEARSLVASAREQGAATVGVFRNEKLMQVALAARELELDAVQLHGEEDLGYINGLRNIVPEHIEIWAASGVSDTVQSRVGADRLLFDTVKNGRSGGTGTTFDWSHISGRRELRNALLAGGLAPGNARAASRLGAYALDVGSGVEAAPGRKDPDKLSAFFDALRGPSRGDRECA